MAFAPRATATRATPMIPSELTHALPRTASRHRRYTAPGDAVATAPPHDAGHLTDDHRLHLHFHQQQQQQQPAARYPVPPASYVTPVAERDRHLPDGESPNVEGGGCGDRGSRRQVCIRMFLPKSFPEVTRRGESQRVRELRSWRELPENPLNGLPGLTTEPVVLQREECKFYCDPCQKGFFTQERYDKHMTEHIWCKVPGCNFTCRSGKEWKMEMHMETLHNRPDAPNLVDVGTYLAQRRGRFPTQDTIKAKMEELFYKASRGVVLPDERRRWLRQHGILVRKHPRTEEAYIASDALRDPLHATGTRPGERNKEPSQHQKRQREEEQHEGDDVERREALDKANDNAGENQPLGDAGDSAVNQPPPPPPRCRRPMRIYPLGPNGTLTRAQRVQLVRERYRESRTVPRFYVCNRCGEKGVHWVDECPTKGDKAFERQMIWGEERREPPRQKYRTEAEVEMKEEEEEATLSSRATSAGSGEGGVAVEDPSASDEDANSAPGDVIPGDDSANPADGALEIVEDDGPPTELPARIPKGEYPARDEVTRMLAPVAAAAAAAAAANSRSRRRGEQQKHQQRRGARHRPLPPTLFERLVDSDKVNERGLLLQAFRFFVMRRFFDPL